MSRELKAIAFKASLDIEAADGAGPPKFSTTAYTGGMMNIVGHGPLVVDLTGMRYALSIIANAHHDKTGIVGHVTDKINDGRTLVLKGIVSGAGSAAAEVVASHANGFPWQASIEATPKAFVAIKAGESRTINGQTFKGPFKHVTESELYGVAFVPRGADQKTTVIIAAKRDPKMEATFTTSFEIQAALDTATDPADIQAAEQARTRFLANKRPPRMATAEQAKQYEAIKAQALNGEVPIQALNEFSLSIMEANSPKGPVTATGIRDMAGGSENGIAAMLLCRNGLEAAAVESYGEQVVEHARRCRNKSLVDICAMALTADGRDVGNMGRHEMIKASFSTVSLQNAFGNAINRSLMQSYTEANSTWRAFANIQPAADFKTQTGIRPSFVGNMEQVAPDGNLKHGTLAESTYDWNVDTFGKILKVTRQDVINDDLGFLNQTAPGMAKMAARGLNDLVWGKILANGGSFFASGHGNLLDSGAPSALDATSLALAIRMMRQQRDAQHNDLDIQPIVLVVPPELEQVGKALLNSEYIQKLATAEGPTGNTLKAALTLQVESRLSNTAKFSTGSTTAWYLFAGPADAPVIVGFLDGNQSPTVEYFGLESDINNLGVGWRIYHDYGAALGDYRAAVKSPGA